MLFTLIHYPKVCYSHWFIIPKYDVHTSNSLQDIRHNHWTVKYTRSCWPSLHDTQVNVTRLTDVWPTIYINCLHTRKVEKKKKNYTRPLQPRILIFLALWTINKENWYEDYIQTTYISSYPDKNTDKVWKRLRLTLNCRRTCTQGTHYLYTLIHVVFKTEKWLSSKCGKSDKN